MGYELSAVTARHMTGMSWSSTGFREAQMRASFPFSVSYVWNSGGGVNPEISREWVDETVALKDLWDMVANSLPLLPRRGLPNRVPLVSEICTSGGAATYKVNPWCLCDGVRIQRNEKNGLIFDGAYDYSTPGGLHLEQGATLEKFTSVDVPTDLQVWKGTNWIRQTLWRDDSRIVYEDSQSSGQVKLRLPTGSLYSEPFRRRHAVKEYRQWQFEDPDLDWGSQPVEDIVQERMFTINTTPFANDPVPDHATDVPPRWMITDINYQKVEMPYMVASVLNWKTMYLMVYTLERNDLPGGWWDRRALIDKFYLTSPNNLATKEPYRDPADKITVIDCLLEEDGTFDQTRQDDAVPLYINYRIQPELAFTFLQDGPLP